MNIQEYIQAQLAAGHTMEDIMNDITASANAVEKAFNAAKVKDYTRPMNLDNEILTAIHKDTLTSELIADIFLYWIGKNTPEILLSYTDKELVTARNDLANELKDAMDAVGRFVKIVNDDTKNDFDKLYALTAEMVDSKLNKSKAKVKNDEERISEMMRKLGF